ncbi:NAC domain-containing protein 1 [Camellia lanceoleosa]|uniref:NAC domain-containing protein 1 n=1 Tax=Camellia lanceoleosa TaxID=1840588 RepID=A0ACC0FMZ1_9ERIC|nr:NAC domain-containing protein 1 [Camellia lanceoleosa]
MYGLKREEEWYFFTRRDKKSSSSRQPRRTAGDRLRGDGYLKATSGDTPIRSNNTIVGYKKFLAFFKGTDRSRGVKTPWLMQEYTLHCQININTATTTKAAGDMKPILVDVELSQSNPEIISSGICKCSCCNGIRSFQISNSEICFLHKKAVQGLISVGSCDAQRNGCSDFDRDQWGYGF